MAEQRAKRKMKTREFLAIVTESGEHIPLDDEIVRKYHLRAGLVSPFSSLPIISVTLPVSAAPPSRTTAGDGSPQRKRVGAGKTSPRKSAARKPIRKTARPKGKKSARSKR